MPRTVTNFTVIRGNKIIKSDTFPPPFGACYLRSLNIAKYNSAGEFMNIYDMDNSANDKYYPIHSNLNTSDLIDSLNQDLLTNHDGLILDINGFTYPDIGTHNYQIVLSEGIANRLGYESNKYYTIGAAYSKTIKPPFPPIVYEPEYIKLYINSEYIGMNKDFNSIYNISYPVYMDAISLISEVNLVDQDNRTVYVPATFQLTYLPNFHRRPTQRVLKLPEVIGDDYSLELTSGKEMAIKTAYIKNSRYFSGDETLTLLHYDTSHNLIDSDTIRMRKGWLSQTHYEQLGEFNRVYDIDTDVNNTGDRIEISLSISGVNDGEFLKFTSTDPQLHYMFLDLETERTISDPGGTNTDVFYLIHNLNVGEQYPLYYEITIGDYSYCFSTTNLSEIEWKEVKDIFRTPVTITSYDNQGEKIRKIKPNEYQIEFLFR